MLFCFDKMNRHEPFPRVCFWILYLISLRGSVYLHSCQSCLDALSQFPVYRRLWLRVLNEIRAQWKSFLVIQNDREWARSGTDNLTTKERVRFVHTQGKLTWFDSCIAVGCVFCSTEFLLDPRCLGWCPIPALLVDALARGSNPPWFNLSRTAAHYCAVEELGIALWALGKVWRDFLATTSSENQQYQQPAEGHTGQPTLSPISNL